MKIKLGIIFPIFLLIFFQSCIVVPQRDYQGFSKSLVFKDNKKWMINKALTDLNSTDAIKFNQNNFELFNKLSNGNAKTIMDAQKENLIPNKIAYHPSLDELETLKNSTDFDYLVNSYTKNVRDEIANIETELPFQYSKNEAFVIVEVYDLKSLKKIYYQKVSSSQTLEGRKYPSEQTLQEQINRKSSGPNFSYSANQLIFINQKKLLKDISKNAIK